MTEWLKLLCSLSLSGTILAGLTALILVPLRRRVPRAFGYYLWLLVLLRFLCPLGADQSLSHRAVAQSETFWVVAGTERQGLEEQNNHQGENLVIPDAATVRTVSMAEFLTVLWAGGVTLVLAVRLWSGSRLRRELERGAVPVQPWEEALYRTVAGRQSGVPALFRAPGAQGPMLAGLLRPRIYLPLEEMPREALGHALRHELVHWRRKDLWYKYAVTLVTAVHWFNPAIWLLARAVDRDCELSCDEAVVRSLAPEERTDYGRTLLWAAEGQIGAKNSLSASLWGQKQVLKERLYAVMKPNRTSKRTIALLAAAVLSLTAVSAALGAYAGAEEPVPQTPPVLEPAKPVTDVLPDQSAEEKEEAPLAWPFEDTEEIVLSALYRRRMNLATGGWITHRGIDIVLEEGTPVLACAPGRVDGYGFNDVEGNLVSIDHGNGLRVTYACLAESDFAGMETVEAGQVIGTVGNTGASTGAHLHLEVRLDNQRVDPLDYLPHGEVFVGQKDETTPLIW